MSGEGGLCPRCATPFAAGQGYCLECGLRLDPDASPPESDAAPAAPPPQPNRTWIWAALGGFVVAAAGAAVAIAVSGTGSATVTLTTAVAPVTTVTPSATDTGAQPPPATTVAVTTVATVPAAPVDTATATNGGKPKLIVWPGKTAYTVVLDSLPSPGAHAAALAQANRALAKGLPQVGVLDSGDFPSLNPGYYVVFSGVYGSLLLAETASRNARFQGFGSAYPRQIKR